MDLSEFELIGKIADEARASDRFEIGIGDDAAVVRGRGRIVTSVDTAVAGVHFDLDRPAAESARKAVASAISDLAAMGLGAGNTEILVALGAPPDTTDAYLEALAGGVAAAAEEFGADLAGGDVVASPVLFLSVTVIAHIDDETPVVGRKSAAGGEVLISGPIGGAAAGLALLNGLEVSSLSPEDRAYLIDRQLRPNPRLDVAVAASNDGALAMIDISDGLLADLGHVARASGFHIRLPAHRIPIDRGVADVARALGRDPLEFAVNGGEDYELAFIYPGPILRHNYEIFHLPVPVYWIGQSVTPDHGGPLVGVHDGQGFLDLGHGGHDHFRGSDSPSR
jgi:thiamine-monophosphate kinase